jgi:general stress protein 26
LEISLNYKGDRNMGKTEEHKDSIAKIAGLIKGIKFAMLTTEEEDGSLRSRPMATQQVEFDGDLWFFTDKSSAKVKEVEHHHEINVSYADQGNSTYVSVSGKAELVLDKNKVEELWNPFYQSWFPEGVNDPNIALLKVNVEKAEFWDSTSNKMVQLAGFLKAVVTGQEYHASKDEHGKVNF